MVAGNVNIKLDGKKDVKEEEKGEPKVTPSVPTYVERGSAQQAR